MYDEIVLRAITKIKQSVLRVQKIQKRLCCPIILAIFVYLQYTATLTELLVGIFFRLDFVYFSVLIVRIFLTLMHLSQLPLWYFHGKHDFIICHQ